VQRRLSYLWGGAQALLARAQRFSWVDLLAFVAVGGLVFGVVSLARQWAGPHQSSVEIDLSPAALPGYTLLSLARGLLAYGLSLGFTLVYGYWAAKDRVAERGLIPLLDILQSIPVLGFMPGVVRGMAGLLPGSNAGLEFACVVMIFTGQAWNMTFSYYHSLRSIPPEQQEAATVYHFSWWERLRWLELPFATMGLVWNSMMSMAGGWFFLMTTEAFSLGPNEDYRLPGLGSYMSVAAEEGNAAAMCWGVLAMVAMIVAVDQLVWRPVMVWAQKYRVEEGGYQEAMSSWFLNLLRRSRALAALAALREKLGQLLARQKPAGEPLPPERPANPPWAAAVSLVAFLLLLAGLGYGAWLLILLLAGVPVGEWGGIGAAAGLTLGRVVLSTALGTLWALPAGLAIGLSPRLSRVLQPVIQVVASFPAPMLFPWVVAVLTLSGVHLNWGSIVLMLLGTQWYILFNVIAGAMAIPADLKEAARSYGITGWQRFRVLYAPAVFPYLVTGWVTAAGGAWNTSIVAEYVTQQARPPQVAAAGASVVGLGASPLGTGPQAAAAAYVVGTANPPLEAQGLGARITEATRADDAGALAASILVMSLVVVVFNRLVWKRLYRVAEERFSLAK
jgi:NitT/TauT family transport system permease protein